MPRYRFKTLLIGMAVVAIWLATFSGFTGAEDVRAFIVVAILVTSGVAALSSVGRQRAFWGGFVATYFILTARVLSTLAPNFRWILTFTREWGMGYSNSTLERSPFISAANATIAVLLILVASALLGLMSVYVYDQCQESQDK
jgi:hypothetical protein